MSCRLVCAAAALLALSTASARAETGVTYSGGAQPLTNAPFTLGWEFQLTQFVKLDGLGVLDATGAGLADSHEVGLWDASGDLIASATVDAGTTDSLTANFRYADVTPVSLAPGEYYIGALYADGNDAVGMPVLGGGAVTTGQGVTYLQATYTQGATLDDPTNGNGSPGYFGPNFTASVPEPGAWALMLAGLGLVGAGLRRRPRAAASV